MRTFIAIEIPATVREQIEPVGVAVKAHLSASGLGRAVRWTQPSKLHLTLRFLGETNESQRHSICQGLHDAIPQHAPIQLIVNSMGCFPNQRSPRVFWLGLGGALDRLASLQADVERTAQQAGFAAERRAFSPHLTIGRTRRGLSKADLRKLGEVIRALDSVATELLADQREALTFEVNELVFMESVLKPEGAHYSVLERFRL